MRYITSLLFTILALVYYIIYSPSYVIAQPGIVFYIPPMEFCNFIILFQDNFLDNILELRPGSTSWGRTNPMYTIQFDDIIFSQYTRIDNVSCTVADTGPALQVTYNNLTFDVTFSYKLTTQDDKPYIGTGIVSYTSGTLTFTSRFDTLSGSIKIKIDKTYIDFKTMSKYDIVPQGERKTDLDALLISLLGVSTQNIFNNSDNDNNNDNPIVYSQTHLSSPSPSVANISQNDLLSRSSNTNNRNNNGYTYMATLYTQYILDVARGDDPSDVTPDTAISIQGELQAFANILSTGLDQNTPLGDWGILDLSSYGMIANEYTAETGQPIYSIGFNGSSKSQRTQLSPIASERRHNKPSNLVLTDNNIVITIDSFVWSSLLAIYAEESIYHTVYRQDNIPDNVIPQPSYHTLSVKNWIPLFPMLSQLDDHTLPLQLTFTHGSLPRTSISKIGHTEDGHDNVYVRILASYAFYIDVIEKTGPREVYAFTIDFNIYGKPIITQLEEYIIQLYRISLEPLGASTSYTWSCYRSKFQHGCDDIEKNEALTPLFENIYNNVIYTSFKELLQSGFKIPTLTLHDNLIPTVSYSQNHIIITLSPPPQSPMDSLSSSAQPVPRSSPSTTTTITDIADPILDLE